ncbi:hypothetical protein Leryth_000428 [Lithospermum erythrorhizon]|nr:hypothetical protein Leryth_000428 [Lithospermum erythrorhizon]
MKRNGVSDRNQVPIELHGHAMVGVPGQKPPLDFQPVGQLTPNLDYLRIWGIDEGSNRVELKSVLNCNRDSEFSGPLTSFDWNEADPRRIERADCGTQIEIEHSGDPPAPIGFTIYTL